MRVGDYKTAVLAATLLVVGAGTASAQNQDDQNRPFEAGQPLGTVENGRFVPMSNNVKVYGGVVNAESCTYDPTRGVIVVVNRGVGQTVQTNDAFVSLLNHDGSVNTARWIGVNRNGLVLNDPFGSAIANGRLYVADSNGGTSRTDPRVAVVRWFDMRTGAPLGESRLPESTGLNGLAVAADGTVYGSQTGDPQRIFRMHPDGRWDVFVDGAPLNRPNGVAIDRDGNIVVVNIGSDEVQTFSPEGKLLKTEHAAQSGSDGLVILPDGTKYVSSVVLGGVSRIRPGQAGELIASNIPSAASMCYDSGANQLVIPMNANSGVAIIPLH